MPPHSWMKRNYDSIPDGRTFPEQLVLVRSRPVERRFVGAVVRQAGLGALEAQLIVVSPAHTNARAVALLLALLVLDLDVSILQSSLMPYRPPTAILWADGTIRHGRNRSFDQWVLKEIQRISAWLERQHCAFIDGCLSALEGRPPRNFTKAPPSFPLSGQGVYFAPRPPTTSVDRSQSPAVQHRLKRHQLVRWDYRRDRYLSSLSDDELDGRTNSILLNLHIINDRNQVGLPVDDPHFRYWMDRLTEVMEEKRLRFGPYPAGWHSGIAEGIEYPRGSGSDLPQLSGVTELRPGAPYLVKYGKATHMRDALEAGRLWIRPASSYKDESLRNAVRDDELNLVTSVQAELLSHQLTGIERYSRVQVTKRAASDFYAYCMTDLLQLRLFYDFAAEAALLVHDPDAFLARFSDAIRAELPGWRVEGGPVQYFDPLNVLPGEIEPIFWKDFRYWYQREVRICALPKQPTKRELKAFELSIGPLHDIAELVELAE